MDEPTVLQRASDDMAALVTQVRGSLVQVHNGKQGIGAGSVWRSDGLVITNAHVVRCRKPQVTLADGRSYQAQVLAADRACDLAVLQIDAHGLQPITRGTCEPLQPGQWVLALGHPWGVAGAVTGGIVIAVGVPPEMPHWQGELIQISAPLRPGHSGGPLVDAQGRLVGINTMMAGPEVGLAIPLPVITTFLQQHLGATG